MLARSGRERRYAIYDSITPRAMPSAGVEMLNGKIGRSGKRYMFDGFTALPGVGRPSHRPTSRVNSVGTNVPSTRTSFVPVPFSPAAYQVSRTSQSFFGSRHQMTRLGRSAPSSKIG